MKSQNLFFIILIFLTLNISAEEVNSFDELDNKSTSAISSVCAVGNVLTLVLNFGANPQHTSWDIRDANYNILVGSSGFTTPNTTLTHNVPWLPDGDYLLVVYDVNGDGMASDGGSYQLKDSQGNILVSGSSFAASDVNEFCIGSSNGGGLDLIPPTVPLNLTATNPTQSSIDIAFTAATDNLAVLGYVVFMNDVYIGDIYAAGPLSVTVPNLDPATTYTFKVATIDIAGNFSPFSNAATETTLSNSVTFHEGYFETGWDGWIDGGNDCYRYSGNKSAEGAYSIRLRDNSGTRSAMTLENQNLSSFSDVTIDFEYYIRSFETNEDFWLRYYDGSSWQTVATFQKGVDFTGNGFYSGSVNLSSIDYNFAVNAGFRFQCDASQNNDKVFIDQVVMTGHYPVSTNLMRQAADYASNIPFKFEILDAKKSRFLVTSPLETVKLSGLEDEIKPLDFEINVEENPSNVSVFPNPAGAYFNLSVQEDDLIESVKIYNTNGRLIKMFKPMNYTYDISDLKTGMYVIEISTKNNSIQYLKLMKTM